MQRKRTMNIFLLLLGNISLVRKQNKTKQNKTKNLSSLSCRHLLIFCGHYYPQHYVIAYYTTGKWDFPNSLLPRGPPFHSLDQKQSSFGGPRGCSPYAVQSSKMPLN